MNNDKTMQFFRKSVLIFLLAILSSVVFAQVFTNKEVGKKNAVFIDSLKKSDYPYSLPILGAKATKAGYNLPYSAGVSINYFWQVSDLIIDNLKVGFNNGPMYNLDEIVRFDKAVTTASATTIRPDIWLFPFLNIYGIFGTAKASTEVGFGIWKRKTSLHWALSCQLIRGGSTSPKRKLLISLWITHTVSKKLHHPAFL